MSCDSNASFSMSEFCLSAWKENDDFTLECLPELFDEIFGTIIGIWIIINGTIGIFGNLFTLIAIPYAAKRKM